MTHTDRRRMRGDLARAAILEHAIPLASTQGLEGLSIGRVASDAGVAKSNIQALFGDKEGLQLATLEMAVDLYQRIAVAPAMSLPSPRQRLYGLVEAWFDFVARRTLPGGCIINATGNEYRSRPGPIRDRIIEHRTAIRQRLEAVIQDAQSAGELRDDLDTSQLVFELLAYQATANVAALMGDQEEFARARSSSLERLKAAET